MGFIAAGETLGSTVNPTPLNPLAVPQPFRCLRSPSLPSAVCGSVSELSASTDVPWVATKGGGFGNPAVFTLQGIIEDLGAGNATGFSVTNAVVLRIE